MLLITAGWAIWTYKQVGWVTHHPKYFPGGGPPALLWPAAAAVVVFYTGGGVCTVLPRPQGKLELLSICSFFFSKGNFLCVLPKSAAVLEPSPGLVSVCKKQARCCKPVPCLSRLLELYCMTFLTWLMFFQVSRFSVPLGFWEFSSWESLIMQGSNVASAC